MSRSEVGALAQSQNLKVAKADFAGAVTGGVRLSQDTRNIFKMRYLKWEMSKRMPKRGLLCLLEPTKSF